MSEWQHRFVKTNGIRMHYVEQGTGFPVLMMHGFPEMWYSWRFQIPALAKAGFRAIAPDMRGYGDTEVPQGIPAYDIHHLVDDMVGLLDAIGFKKAVIVGHDWGGVIVWQMALLRPERVERVISLNTPFRGRGERVPRTPTSNSLMAGSTTSCSSRSRAAPRRAFSGTSAAGLSLR